MTSKLGIGLIGAGSVSQVHAGAYSEDGRVKLLAVCDTNYQIAENFANKYNIEKIHATTCGGLLGSKIAVDWFIDIGK